MKSYNKLAILLCIVIASTACTKGRLINEPGNLVPKTVDQDSSLPSITVKGAQLHSEAFGHPDSTMVVFIHGGPGGDYRSLLKGKQLANFGYRVIFYDQRGSGLSQRFPASTFSKAGIGAIDTLYNELSAVIAHYRTKAAQKVILVGHSWGGMLATGYAGRYPGNISGLVVAEPGGYTWDDIQEYVARSRSFKLWGEALNDVTWLDQFMTGREDQHAILDYKASISYAKNDITGDPEISSQMFWRAGIVINSEMLKIGQKYSPDFSAGINDFHVPVLFIYSGNNKAYQHAWAEKISAVFKQVSLYKVEATGHEGIFMDASAWQQSTMPTLLNYLRSR